MLASADPITEGSQFGDELFADAVVGKIIERGVVGDQTLVVMLPKGIIFNAATYLLPTKLWYCQQIKRASYPCRLAPD